MVEIWPIYKFNVKHNFIELNKKYLYCTLEKKIEKFLLKLLIWLNLMF